ncbi:hypothetical protein CO019_00210, partial [Candidatus Berkelbacteria bacterium CG_4_9_14_0_2_um_filter_42_30]
RASVSNPTMLERILSRAIKSQVEKNNFSFIEILSICPTNWKTNARESFEFLTKMEKIYPIGEMTKSSRAKSRDLWEQKK